MAVAAAYAVTALAAVAVASGAAATVRAVTVASLELDLEVFSGPFDLLLTLVLREEVDLLEVELADVVLAYLDFLEARGELDLEVATEFLVLIAALLELKSRLMLPREDEELLDLEPGEAAEELLARMLEAQRYRRAAGAPHRAPRGRGRRALPLGAAAAEPAPRRPRPTSAVYDPARLGAAVGGLLRMPAPISLGHLTIPRVTVAERLVAPARAAAPRRHAPSTRPCAAPIASRSPSRCSRCSSSTSRARRPGSRTSPSATSRSRRWPSRGRLSEALAS